LLRKEANVKEGITLEQTDDNSIANFVLFYNEDEANNPKAYDQSYSRLVKWVDDSIDIYKVFQEITYSLNSNEFCTQCLFMHILILLAKD
jgi:hypothetical protein